MATEAVGQRAAMLVDNPEMEGGGRGRGVGRAERLGALLVSKKLILHSSLVTRRSHILSPPNSSLRLSRPLT